MHNNVKKAPFTWGPISKKQLQMLSWWHPSSPHNDKDGIIADGSVRSTKTLSLSFSFLEWAENTFQNPVLGASGKTIKSFERNVLGQLKQVALGRGYTYQHNKSDNFIIFTRGNNSVTIYIFGGKDEASQDLVQGITLAGFLFDEVALQPESFVHQAIARCSIDGSKLWFNCNPAGPYHYFKVNFLDKCNELNLLHIHTTIDDNLTLSDRIKARYKRMYSGVFYKRYILGQWVAADGLVYDMFDEQQHVVHEPDKHSRYVVGVDVGTANPTAFVRVGITGRNAQVVDEWYYDGRKNKQKTDAEFAVELERFVGGDKSTEIIVDPSALSFKTELRRRGFTRVRDAKNSVLDGIRFVASMLHADKLTVCSKCANLIQEFTSYLWDTKAQDRGEDKPAKEHDHALDALRYVLFTLLGRSQGGNQEFRL